MTTTMTSPRSPRFSAITETWPVEKAKFKVMSNNQVKDQFNFHLVLENVENVKKAIQTFGIERKTDLETSKPIYELKISFNSPEAVCNFSEGSKLVSDPNQEKSVFSKKCKTPVNAIKIFQYVLTNNSFVDEITKNLANHTLDKIKQDLDKFKF
ncbi:MAG: hypothetical protein BGO14_09540 [Chlamydiales bacterium 38-26]|nr:hypothetical protein [Chlamydiales bacterium]OJV11216.1 MAG: hypothetical protein BGO14_09540 [Chlamydiales bacterium 38-26]